MAGGKILFVLRNKQTRMNGGVGWVNCLGSSLECLMADGF